MCVHVHVFEYIPTLSNLEKAKADGCCNVHRIVCRALASDTRASITVIDRYGSSAYTGSAQNRTDAIVMSSHPVVREKGGSKEKIRCM